MINILVENKLLTFAEYSFRPKMSCINSMNQVIEDMGDRIDLKCIGRAGFIDHKEAFDTLHQRIFLTKQSYYDFQWNYKGTANEFFKQSEAVHQQDSAKILITKNNHK